MRDYIILDTETGGFNPKEHSLLTIGIVFVKDGKVVDKKEWQVKSSTYNVTPQALKVNKLNLTDLYEHGDTIEQIRKEFIVTMKDLYKSSKPTLIGHNVGFDMGFIYEQLLNKQAWESLVSYRRIDTMDVARFLQDVKILNTKKIDLSSLMVFFNLGNELSEGRHSALFDAQCTWTVFCKMGLLTKEG